MQPLVSPRPELQRPRLRWRPVLGMFLLAVVGYFAAWIWHPAAGLVITGVDLAEYVKFLPPFRDGQITVLRESFYAPLVASSLIASLVASRRVLPVWLRWVAGLGAIPLALAMLPPAWSPAVLASPEFRLQVAAIVVCMAAVPLFFVTRILPDWVTLIAAGLLSLIAATWPAFSFLAVLKPIATIYASALRPGWGFWLATAGFLITAFLSFLGAIPRRAPRRVTV